MCARVSHFFVSSLPVFLFLGLRCIAIVVGVSMHRPNNFRWTRQRRKKIGGQHTPDNRSESAYTKKKTKTLDRPMVVKKCLSNLAGRRDLSVWLLSFPKKKKMQPFAVVLFLPCADFGTSMPVALKKKDNSAGAPARAAADSKQKKENRKHALGLDFLVMIVVVVSFPFLFWHRERPDLCRRRRGDQGSNVSWGPLALVRFAVGTPRHTADGRQGAHKA